MHLITPQSSGAGGGGGGIEIEWAQGVLAPPMLQEYPSGANTYMYRYPEAGSFYLYATFRVPDSYTAGTQIDLKGFFITSVTSGTVLFETTSYLLRPDTDQPGVITNSHTSTNSAITVNASTNVLTEFTCDLTDENGEMNSVAVSPGDIIQIRIRRNPSDTAAADAFLLTKAYEVSL